jgi:hypothetical protein
MKMINYLLNVIKFVKNEALFVQSFNEYSPQKNNSSQAKTFGILSLFV